MLYGPNTNLAHNSIVFMIESQICHVMACPARLGSDGVCSIEMKKIFSSISMRDSAAPAKRHLVQGLHELVSHRCGKKHDELAGLFSPCSGSEPARRAGTIMLLQ